MASPLLESKSFNRALITLLLLQFSLFVYQTFLRIYPGGLPIVYWDLNLYYLDAARFFVDPSWEWLQLGVRPLFSWPSLLLMKLSGSALKYQTLVATTSAFYHLSLIAALCFYARQARLAWSQAGLALSCYWALPQVLDNSAQLLGDIACTPWVILFSALLLWARHSDYRSLLRTAAIGVTASLALQLKPILLPTLALILVPFVLQALLNFPQLTWKRGIASFSSLLLSAGITAWLVCPHNLTSLISEMHYNNEVLGYWASRKDLSHSVFWVPSLLLAELCLPASLIFLAALALSGAVGTAHQARTARAEGISAWLKGLAARPELALPAATLLLAGWASFGVQTKGGRTFLFLILLLMLLTIRWTYWMVEHWGRPKVWRAGALLLAGLNGLSFLSIAVKNVPSFSIPFTYTLNLPDLELVRRRPLLPTLTYEALGIPSLYSLITADWKRMYGSGAGPFIFFPHSTYSYNESVFNSYACQKLTIRKEMPDECIHPPLYATNAMFQYGTLNYSGGIPRNFFGIQYIIVVKDKTEGHLRGSAEIYNRFFSEKILAKDPDMLDGVAKFGAIRNQLGDKILLYHRLDMPKPSTFARIVARLAEADPGNFWNVPLVAAALRVDPQSYVLEEQWRAFSELNEVESKTYRVGSPDYESRIHQLLSAPIYDPSLTELDYPKVLSW